MKYALALHGGAGTITRNLLTPEKEAEYKKGLSDALAAGQAVLETGGSAMDAVEATVRSLENCPLFNAGKGAVFTHTGEHEMDAAIMSGSDLTAGAVAGVKNVKNPVTLARTILEKTDHVMLSGAGALELAKKEGLEIETDEYFFNQFRYDQYLEAKEHDRIQLDHAGERKFGTVGAVALDKNGNLAAATSTGGMTNKRYNRIGDSPIIGAGTYANNETCAISCTGHGELFIRSVVAFDIHALMSYKNLSLQAACDEVVLKKLVKIEGEGGLVAVDKDGNICLSFNSEGMYRASVKEGEVAEVAIYRD